MSIRNDVFGTCNHFRNMTALRIQVFWDTTMLWWGNVSRHVEEMSVMKRHFVVTRTIHQTDIPALLDSWVTNRTSVKILCPQKEIVCPYVIAKT